ncbi:MAG: dienelactone hydrolase family protein [Acidobacteriia bacterium]|nr:dienelactone hydrolase family protein [Terriglobia bacterium]
MRSASPQRDLPARDTPGQQPASAPGRVPFCGLLPRSFAVIALLLAGALSAQTPQTGPQVLTFFSSVDDTDQPYAIYLPKGFDPTRKYPLVMSLHGAGSNHRLNLRRVFGQGNLPGQPDAEATRSFPALPDVEFIVASPLARGTIGYQGIGERDTYDVLADVKKRFPIDEDRIYLTGLSMGGGGTVWLGLTRPDVWAAIAPVCAAVPPGASELAPNALNLPVHLFHGEIDPVVPVASSRGLHKQLLELETAVQYTEYPGVRHNSWDNAYKDAAIFRWFSQHRRNRFPQRVRFATRTHDYRSAYWVAISMLIPSTLAKIDARFTGPNQITIDTTSIVAFTLDLTGHPSFVPGKPIHLIMDGGRYSSTGPQMWWRRTENIWENGRATHSTSGKRPGAEGPIFRAISGRHIYVYGTADSPEPVELERRRKIAMEAADWTWSRFRPYLLFKVLADRDVREEDQEGADLVLFGTSATNSLIAKHARHMAIELNPGAADYGLVQVLHAGGRHILVSSGLPWWTGSEEAAKATPRYLPLIPRLLLAFKDYVLFRGELNNLVAAGFLDSNWKVPVEVREKVQALGVATVFR